MLINEAATATRLAHAAVFVVTMILVPLSRDHSLERKEVATHRVPTLRSVSQPVKRVETCFGRAKVHKMPPIALHASAGKGFSCLTLTSLYSRGNFSRISLRTRTLPRLTLAFVGGDGGGANSRQLDT